VLLRARGPAGALQCVQKQAVAAAMATAAAAPVAAVPVAAVPVAPAPLARTEASGFGAHLVSQMWPDWRDTGYVRYDALETFIGKAMTVSSGSVCLPGALLQDFVDRLDKQLERVNTFCAEMEAEISKQWAALVLPRSELGLEKTRSILSVLKTHLHKKCNAEPGQCSAYNRLRLQTENEFARFAVLHERTQNLRQLVALNYLAFNKIMDKFEAQTGLGVKQVFTPRLQQAKFYNSPGVPRLVTEMDCVANDLILRADSHRPEDLREEFTCGVCLDVLRNPVVLSCAHRFCWHCAASSCVSSSSCDDWNCPVCRKVQPVNQEVFTVNSQLQTFIKDHVVDPAANTDSGEPKGASVDGPSAPFSRMPDASEFDFDDLVRMKGASWREQNQQQAHTLDSSGDTLPPPCDPPPPPPPAPRDDDKAAALKAYAAQMNEGSKTDPNIGLRQPLPQKFVGRWLSLSDDFFAARDGAETHTGEAASTTKAAAAASSVLSHKAVSKSAELVALGVPTTTANAAVAPVPVPVAQSVLPHAVAAPAAKAVGKNASGDASKPKRKRGRPPADASLTAEERKLNRLKKNRIAAQRSYKKRVENTNKLEKENQDLHERVTQAAAALEVAQGQWRQYAAFVARHGLQSAADEEDGLMPPPPDTVARAVKQETAAKPDERDANSEVAQLGVLPLEDFPVPGVAFPGLAVDVS
jgi:hypothetical protein